MHKILTLVDQPPENTHAPVSACKEERPNVLQEVILPDHLIGRVYLDTTQNLSRRAPIGTPYLPPTGDLLHHVQQQMEQHRNLEHLSRAYFDGLLTDTRSRASSDSKYARAVNDAVQAARYNWNSGRDDYQCYVDGMPWPMIACRTLLLCTWWMPFSCTQIGTLIGCPFASVPVSIRSRTPVAFPCSWDLYKPPNGT